MTDLKPVSPREFSNLMSQLAPFETQPRLAVAVSGGADSLALAVLTTAWCRRRGGTSVALTVDHALRDGSADESRQVGRWLRDRGIRHHRIALHWPDGRPQTRIQELARAMRYEELMHWCRDHGYLHLLVGHQLEDQAETVLMRLGHGSGADGLAGMAAIVERRHCRILRPLLAVPKARLVATLNAAGLDWLEDPSNSDTRYERVRLREVMPSLQTHGLSAEGLAASSWDIGAQRADADAQTNRLMAQMVSCDPAGFVRIDLASYRRMAAGLGVRLLGRALMTVAGLSHPPRRQALIAARQDIVSGGRFAGRTLAGCRILASGRAPRSTLYVCREVNACEPPLKIVANQTLRWDRRFELTPQTDLSRPGHVGALGQLIAPAQRRSARRELPAGLPAAVISTLPTVSQGRSLFVADELLRSTNGAKRQTQHPTLRPLSKLTGSPDLQLRFIPAHPLTAGFGAVTPLGDEISH